VWELYDLRADRTQTHNLDAEHPELLEQLKGLWFYYAGIYKGLPLDDRTALEILTSWRPEPSEPRDRYVYYPGAAEVPESVAVNVRCRSYTIAAGATIDTLDAEGVLFAHGGVAGGRSLFVKDGRLHYVYNWLGGRIQAVTSEKAVPTGRHVLTANSTRPATTPDPLCDRDTDPARRHRAGRPGRDHQPAWDVLALRRLAVRGPRQRLGDRSDYTAPFPFTGGTIERVVIDVSGDHHVDHEKEVLAYLTRD
jgi:hypothetical protein